MCEETLIRDPTHKCEFCGVIFWYEEKVGCYYNTTNPKFSLCCMHGKIKLHTMQRPPNVLTSLLYGDSSRRKHFIENIRSYNNMFYFTSMGGKIDSSLNRGGSPLVFRLHGQSYHLMGGLLPPEGDVPKFAQLYIYDTKNEVMNRIRSMR